MATELKDEDVFELSDDEVFRSESPSVEFSDNDVFGDFSNQPFEVQPFEFGGPFSGNAPLPQPEMESFAGDALLGRIGSGIEKSQQLPGKLVYGAADFLQGLPPAQAIKYIRSKIAPQPVIDFAESVEGFPKKMLDSYAARNAYLAKEDAKMDGGSTAGQLAEGTAQAAFELPMQLAAGAGAITKEAAMKTVAAGQGVLAGLSKYAQERGEGKGRLESATQGGTSGLITGVTTAAFGATGVESIFKNEGVKGIGKRILTVLKNSGMEGAEEATDQFQQDLAERITENPNKRLSDTVKEVLMAGNIGTLLGGGVSTVSQAAQSQPSTERPADAPAQPKTEAQEMVLSEQDKDIARAEEIVTAIKTAPLEQRFEMSAELEKIKNKYDGTLPKPGETSEARGIRVIETTAHELGATTKAPEKAAAIDIPEDLSRYSPEDRKKLEDLKNANAAVVEITDRRAGSPTEGLTIYVKPGTKRADIISRWNKAKENYTPIEQQAAAPKPTESIPEPALEEGELIGMGAAVPGEIAPPVQFKTSNKNAVIKAERKARGLGDVMETERRSNQSAWDEAMRRVDENPQLQDELLTELAAEPRALDPVENAMLMHRRIDLRNEYEKALHRWRQAFESDDMVRAAEESQRVKDWSSRLADLENITKQTGAASGRSLQARKMMANEDYTLATMELQAMEAKGRTLTPDEHIQLIKAHEKIAALEAKLRELEEGREAKEVEVETATAMKEVATEAPKEAKSKDFDLDREENLVGAIKAKIEKGQLNEITPLIQQLARVLWRRGIRTREPMIDGLHEILKTISPELTREDTQRAFSGYGNFKPLSKAEIDVGLRDLRGQTQQVIKLEALEARKPLEKTGIERRIPTDEERRLIKQVNELKRKYGVVVTDSATQLKSALAARKTYYEHRISDLKHEIETRQRIVKTKSASPRDAELDAMISEHERLKAEHEQIFGEREITDEQRLKMALAAAERNQAHWQTRLDNAKKGVFTGREKGKKVTSAELEAIKARTEEIKEHVQELKDLANPKKTKEEIALQSLKTRMKTQIAQFQERIAKGDFAKRERKPVQLDAEGNRIKAELDTVKEEFNRRLEQDRWNNSSVFEKSKARVWGVYDLVKTLMSTGEFSFVLRQGKGAFFEALTSPKRAATFAKAFRDGIRSMQSPLKQREIEQQIFSDPMYPQMLRDKLYVPEHGSKLSKQEEFAMGRYADAIPVINAFNRAAETFLKKIRADNYKTMVKSVTKTGTATPEEGRIIAAFINEQTGRGGLGRAEPAAIALNRVFFSPRYLASRLQIASGHQLWSGKWKGTGRARKEVAASYARMLIGASIYYTALMMFFNRDDEEKATLETDFRSSDAGKLKIGETRLDPMAGIAQVTTMAQRTITGEAKDTKGRVFPIVGDVPFGKDDWVGYATRFARSKLHPALGGAIDLRMGENMVGEPATLTSKLTESGPMSYYDIYEALRVQNVDDGVALALLALLGEGLQTYEEREK